jgi:ribosomal protein L14
MDTMYSYSTHPNHYLSEVEVFCGSILGKIGAPSKRQRENSVSMKEKHERDVAYTVACITQGEQNDKRAEALERSIACLHVARTTKRMRRKVGTLVSFGWIAAAVCLREVERFQGL